MLFLVSKINLTKIGWIFLITVLLIILICAMYARYLGCGKKKILSQEALRKRLICDRIIQNVTTVYLVPVSTTVLLQPDNFDWNLLGWTVLVSLPAGLVILIISIINESKNQKEYDRHLNER